MLNQRNVNQDIMVWFLNISDFKKQIKNTYSTLGEEINASTELQTRKPFRQIKLTAFIKF